MQTHVRGSRPMTDRLWPSIPVKTNLWSRGQADISSDVCDATFSSKVKITSGLLPFTLSTYTFWAMFFIIQSGQFMDKRPKTWQNRNESYYSNLLCSTNTQLANNTRRFLPLFWQIFWNLHKSKLTLHVQVVTIQRSQQVRSERSCAKS